MNLNAEQILLTTVHLKLHYAETSGQRVFVVGSIGLLGEWDSARAVALVRDGETPDVWTVTLRLPVGVKVEYRYITKGERGRVVQWEAHSNRVLYPSGMAMTVDDGDFGLSMSTRDVHVDQGWLVDEVSLRITPGNRHGEAAVRATHGAAAPVAPKLRVLFGDLLDEQPLLDETGVYVYTAPSTDDLSFVVDVLEGESDRVWGRACVDARELRDWRGELTRPILGPDLAPRGLFTCEFLVVKPFKHKHNTLSSIWRSYWAPKETLNIGHRGSGSSRSRPAVSENTILSMLTAAKLGAAYVEFDVQITRDGVPVVHHDFTYELVPRDQTSDDVEPIEIPIAQMHSAQLVNMLAPNDDTHARAILGAVRKSRVRRCHSAEDLHRISEERRPPPPVSAAGVVEESDSLTHLLELGFLLPRKPKPKSMTPRTRPRASPLLPEEKPQLGVATNAIGEGIPLFENLFKQVPISVGFNVEVKYPLERRYEKVLGTPERNAFVDAILQVVFDCAGARSIIFSSFDPDIVTLLANKQPRYPVFFLSEAGSKVRSDARCNSLDNAVRFARSLNLRGVVVNAQALLENPSVIGEIKQQQLLVFSFGGANNDERNVRIQKDQGIDGIIADKMIVVASAARRKESLSNWVASDHARVLPPSPISSAALPSIK